MRTAISTAVALMLASPAPSQAEAPPAPASVTCSAAEVAGREAVKIFRNARLAPRPVVTSQPALSSDWKGKTPPAALVERTRSGFASSVLACPSAAALQGTSDGAPEGGAEVEASLPILSADGKCAISLIRMRTSLGVVSAFIYLERRGETWERKGSRMASIS